VVSIFFLNISGLKIKIFYIVKNHKLWFFPAFLTYFVNLYLVAMRIEIEKIGLKKDSRCKIGV